MDDPSNTSLPQGQGVTEVVNQLTNIARQLSVWSQSITNSTPAATTTISPKFTAVSVSTTAAVAIATSTLRHGLMMHNPGTSNIYIYQTGMVSAPTTTVLAGSIVVYPGGTLTLPSGMFSNANAGFSVFVTNGTAQAFTIAEFF